MRPSSNASAGAPGTAIVARTIEYYSMTLYRFDADDHPETPIEPTFPLTPVVDLPPRLPTVPEPADHTLQSRLPWEVATRHLVQNEMMGFQSQFTVFEALLARAMPTINETRSLIWTDIYGLNVLGQDLIMRENLRDHAKAIPTEDNDIEKPGMYWVQRLQSLRSVDRPLAHILRESLHPNTPAYLLRRWNHLRERLAITEGVLANLVRQAELLPRRKWPPLVNELYFLLLDHNEAIRESLESSATNSDNENLVWELGAYCTALRIRFYLWRMTQHNPMCDTQTYRQRVKKECFQCYLKQLSDLVKQEFVRYLGLNDFADVERELVGEAVDVATISEALTSTAAKFCSICQATHPASECVKPRNCSCVFGRACLQPLLNRDTPSSYTCPNCRSFLHEPLDWKLTEDSIEWNHRIGMLWTLRSRVLALEREITADPQPFTKRQHVAGFFGRIVYGR